MPAYNLIDKYKKETGKSPFQGEDLSEGFKLWLEFKDDRGKNKKALFKYKKTNTFMDWLEDLPVKRLYEIETREKAYKEGMRTEQFKSWKNEYVKKGKDMLHTYDINLPLVPQKIKPIHEIAFPGYIPTKRGKLKKLFDDIPLENIPPEIYFLKTLSYQETVLFNFIAVNKEVILYRFPNGKFLVEEKSKQKKKEN